MYWKRVVVIWIAAILAPVATVRPALAQESAPDFTLVDQDGRSTTLGGFRGKVVLMNFIYTNCTDICPLVTAKLVQVQRDLKARGWFGTRVVMLSMSFDPKRDTPTVLKQYAGRFKVDLAGWYFLTGTSDAVDRVLKAYRIPVRAAAKPGLIDHALPVLVINQRGTLLGHYEPDFKPADVLSDLAKLLR